ncbi:MBL fold metallo-hydrolase [Saccharibacillus sp. CPCC 101409]|uniref:MBL fold metallo-hydrolase n=1 Tax=Saccharibacillus sp. CPCC 101409 TaxID=3058041 RepID=UPI0026730DE7|nr:MBL fold metallo-hydrolase [Saccharibacillus sp. CPCC 101409]MDO3409688.1 MBL fold metallo-hydrolase [Saccharibacillus sp. CPCC 101409]
MGMRFTVLSSGSTGNATVVELGDTSLLVDAGLSAKRLEELFREREVSPEHLSGILITHEHSDHIKGLGAIARKYHLPVYANANTWEAMEKHVGKIEPEQRRILETGAAIDFGSLRAVSFGISHDAAEPVGYTFDDGAHKLSLATDLGYMSDKVKESIIDSDVLVLESNHDIEMLRMGRYPWNIKRRILSDIGHLSNVAAGEALGDLLNGRLKRTYLAHLSRDHNMMEIAKMTVRCSMEDCGVFFKDSEFQLRDTHWNMPTPWDEVGSKD